MNDGFLARWSRLKQADRTAPEAAPGRDPDATLPASAEASPVLDIESLPSLESIGPDSDVMAFLQPGVPPELKAQALRRAWIEDPRIRDFWGLNDYDEDFNRPELLNRIVDTVYRVGTGMPDLPPREPEPAVAESPETGLEPHPAESALPDALPVPEASDSAPVVDGPAAPAPARIRRGGATPV